MLIDSLGPGGAERSTAALAAPLAHAGHQVSIVLLRSVPAGYEDEVRAAGVRLEVLGACRFVGRVRELRRILRRDRPDVLHTALFASDQVGRLASFRLPVAVVSSLVNVPQMRQPDSSVWMRTKLRVVRMLDVTSGRLFVDRFHAVTQGVADAYSDSYALAAEKVTVVERGRDSAALGSRTAERRAQVRTREGWSAEDEVVIAVGRHEQDKAHLDLIQAISILAPHRPHLRLVVAGRPGPMTERIGVAIQQHDLDARVDLVGQRLDVNDLIAAADVLASSSTREGAAGAIVEAFGIGTPVVATRLAGLAGVVVDDENAIAVRPGHPEEMADALVRLLDDAALAQRLADSGRHTFESRFTIERAADGMSAVYSRLSRSAS